MRRTPLKRKTPLRPASRLRRTQLRKYSAARLEFLRAQPLCQICRRATSTEAHHTRGRIGQRLLDFEHCLAVCFNCHRKIHSEPRWARACGYLC